MPTYAYLARDDQGRSHRGSRSGPNALDVAATLRREGLLPVHLEDRDRVPWYRRPIHLFGPRRTDIEMQLRQLAFMLRTGLSLLHALRVCGEKGAGAPATRTWRRVGDAIRSGASLHEAMARHRCFSHLTCSLVEVGERSGSLDTVLTRAADAMARQRQTRTQIATALAYPFIVVVLAIATVAFMMTSVIPKLARFMDSLGRQLPASTLFLIDVADAVQAYFLPATVVALGIAAVLALVWSTTRGRILLEGWLLRVPLIGRILRLGAVSTFAHNTALLLASGVRLTSALAVVRTLFFSRNIAARTGRARERVVQGSSLHDALSHEHCFSPLVQGMVAVGESSGTLDEVLAEVAKHHDEVLREFVRRLGTIIEPVILIVIGSIVGFIYFAFFMAIYSITGLGSA